MTSVSCTNAEDRFCGMLRDEYELDDLVTAITQQDQRRVNESLEQLRALQDEAPLEIHDDLRSIIDAVTSAVRVVTKTPTADGKTVPIDLTELNQSLGSIKTPAQHVSDYAEENCGLDLNP